jgi:hypothetical protein
MEYTVPTGKNVETSERNVGHTHAHFKRAGAGTNGILECKLLPKTRTIRVARDEDAVANVVLIELEVLPPFVVLMELEADSFLPLVVLQCPPCL